MRASAGSGVGRGAARGANAWNLGICARDNASAITLEEPGMCLIMTVKLLFAAIKNKQRTSANRLGQRAEPCCHTSTTL